MLYCLHFFFPIVGFIFGIIGIERKEKYSIYVVFISIIIPILYFLVLWNFTDIFKSNNHDV